MTKKGEPKITDCKATDNWTCITFKPDLAKFGMESLDDDIVALMRRRVYDMAGILGKGMKVGERAGRSAAACASNARAVCSALPACFVWEDAHARVLAARAWDAGWCIAST